MTQNELIESQLEDMRRHFLELQLPLYMWEGVRLYLARGVKPGHFLTALFDNDLLQAFAHIDPDNSDHIRSWAIFLSNWIPVGAIGSETKLREWCKGGGMYGRRKDFG